MRSIVLRQGNIAPNTNHEIIQPEPPQSHNRGLETRHGKKTALQPDKSGGDARDVKEFQQLLAQRTNLAKESIHSTIHRMILSEIIPILTQLGIKQQEFSNFPFDARHTIIRNIIGAYLNLRPDNQEAHNLLNSGISGPDLATTEWYLGADNIYQINHIVSFLSGELDDPLEQIAAAIHKSGSYSLPLSSMGEKYPITSIQFPPESEGDMSREITPGDKVRQALDMDGSINIQVSIEAVSENTYNLEFSSTTNGEILAKWPFIVPKVHDIRLDQYLPPQSDRRELANILITGDTGGSVFYDFFPELVDGECIRIPEAFLQVIDIRILHSMLLNFRMLDEENRQAQEILTLVMNGLLAVAPPPKALKTIVDEQALAT